MAEIQMIFGFSGVSQVMVYIEENRRWFEIAEMTNEEHNIIERERVQFSISAIRFRTLDPDSILNFVGEATAPDNPLILVSLGVAILL